MMPDTRRSREGSTGAMRQSRRMHRRLRGGIRQDGGFISAERRLCLLQLDLLLPDGIEKSVDLSLLLGLELLVQLSQAGCTIVVGITAWDQVRRAGHGLGAGCLNAGMTCLLSFVDHLSRGGDRGIVVLEIHEDS